MEGRKVRMGRKERLLRRERSGGGPGGGKVEGREVVKGV
jgi:hypothetical protein